MTLKPYLAAVRFLESFITLPAQKNYLTDRAQPEIYLKRMRYFLRLLGDPQRGFKFIHIAGTAGKGSTAVMLQEMLAANGKRIGLFTSPFCTTAIEKIKVNNAYISPAEFAAIVEDVKPLIKKARAEGPYGGPSYFEIFFAMALGYFQQQRCDWVVCEVGLGGRYDATNVIERPKITAITNINLDHTQILGKTLRAIAYDKAGIIKPGSVFFTTERRPTILKIFREICRQKHAALNIVPNRSRAVTYKNHLMRFKIKGINEPLATPLWGEHQLMNASLAITIARHLKIKERAIGQGLARAQLPGRFEIVQRNPMVVLDGAHNPVKMGSTALNVGKLKFRRLFLVIAIAEDKNIRAILKPIVPLADVTLATSFSTSGRKSYPPTQLGASARQYQRPEAAVRVYEDAHRALRAALGSARAADLILVTGSFFLAGELRKRWYPEKFVLQNRRSFR